MTDLLSLTDLQVGYRTTSRTLTAVDGVTLSIAAGDTVALVGESGCGKSSIARAIVGLAPVTGGRIHLDGTDVTSRAARSSRAFRRRVQMVFQDPYASLNPKLTVGETLEEALRCHHRMSRTERSAEIERLMTVVALDPAHANRYPAQLSGGQRQRVAIARALAVRPDLIIADEITSALDVSVQAAILNLLREIQGRTGVSILLITHNLAVARYCSVRTAVMHLGRIVEIGGTDLYEAPRHPYTRGLLDSAPNLHRRRTGPLTILGDVPDPHHPPPGCRFHPRCPMFDATAQQRRTCVTADPPLLGTEQAGVACHFPLGHGAIDVPTARQVTS
ncbi:ABC transporter ATP-binding protein [Dactylosporangium fulvum]|uniref:ABC transporter ATP-binding protein n=1 Tax=Dactylosporangium fulvum TaxID=53359 RepID=A0ABY5W6D9_9ACTN|nr:ABC transporter ATP-binding protein [Dactylosporangium fulvum]UWP85563.1 ABC transporter ATP-binding protein [Dactylosporangium fulvum]